VAPNPPRATDDDDVAFGALATPIEDGGAEDALLPKPPRTTDVLTDSTV
jgi:hypothetical protein